ncbi:endo-1,4-beta-xylanase A [Cellulomonas chitinilytica]|uniref:Beta-xylanase n=1 Tax=Cellulomonas chitinilytica TaxID=398759 RepID=A0A919P4C5_9CELL|nr:endo-1,4-beta-xylanase [Cellulomonas chitinilytica]GIG23013.1 endo-1,4-beta-xylanase A [Cellulomonas chitinilytica]
MRHGTVRRSLVTIGTASAVVGALLLPAAPGTAAPDGCQYPPGGTVVDADFEDGFDGWAGNGASTAAVTGTDGHDSAHAVLVTGRTAQSDGLGYDVTCTFQPGTTYQFDGWVRFAPGQPTDGVSLTLATTTGGTTSYRSLGSLSDPGDTGWAELSARFTMPVADSALLYVETTWYEDGSGNTSDLLLDDLTVTALPPAQVQDVTPIKDTLDAPVGVAIDSRETVGPAAELLTRHFDQVTPENAMKPATWYAADHSFVARNAEADAVADFAQAHDLRLYGHNLLWHEQTPDWFFQDDDGHDLTDSPADQQVLTDRLRAHIDHVAAYLADRYGPFGSATNPVTAFDVTNEVVSDTPGTPGGMRDTRWFQVLGEGFVDLAFQLADEAFNDTYADPGTDRPVTLLINDYSTEDTGKQARLHDLVARLLARGVPVDGVGHQFHVNLSTPVDQVAAALDAFDDLPVVQAVTELDVPTGTPVTTARLLDQAYWYRDAFAVFRAHDLYSVSVWGLTDGRSWASDSGAPLLFDDDLQAKPAYHGVVGDDLPAQQPSAQVFAGAPPLDTAATQWRELPVRPLGDAAAFQLRWSPDHLTAYVRVDDTTKDRADGLAFTVGDETYTFGRKRGRGDLDGVRAEQRGGWTAVVSLPLDGVAEGDTLEFDVRATDGSATTGWASPGGLGTLELVEPLSVLDVPRAAKVPTVDGTTDTVWADAPVVRTDQDLFGSDGGATAEVRTLWRGDTLYVLADVTDPAVDVSADQPWEQDSLEIFVDTGNAKAGPYREGDAQLRVSATNEQSFGEGDEAAQRARLTSATRRTDHGYVVEAAVGLLGTGGADAFQGLDVLVNDAADGGRWAAHAWADPVNDAWQSTSRWGVAHLVAPSAPHVTTHPASVTVSAGAPVTLTAAATGSPAPTVQWQRRTGPWPWCGWTDVRGATSTSLTLTPGAHDDGDRYRAVFRNASGTATTHEAVLRVTR